MKWSEYDLRLRAECIRLGKPIPGKPEADYDVKWQQPVFNGIHFTPGRDYSKWGKNLQVAVRLDDCESAEDYWKKVRINAARNLDKLKKVYNNEYQKHRMEERRWA